MGSGLKIIFLNLRRGDTQENGHFMKAVTLKSQAIQSKVQEQVADGSLFPSSSFSCLKPVKKHLGGTLEGCTVPGAGRRGGEQRMDSRSREE